MNEARLREVRPAPEACLAQEGMVLQTWPVDVCLTRVSPRCTVDWELAATQTRAEWILRSWRQELEGADEIVCFCVSSEVSATYGAAVVARDTLPDAKITVVDTKNLTDRVRTLLFQAGSIIIFKIIMGFIHIRRNKKYSK